MRHPADGAVCANIFFYIHILLLFQLVFRTENKYQPSAEFNSRHIFFNISEYTEVGNPSVLTDFFLWRTDD